MPELYGRIEFCSHCHRLKRTQFILYTKGQEPLFNYCSQDCLKEHVSRVLFAENADWVKAEFIIHDLPNQKVKT